MGKYTLRYLPLVEQDLSEIVNYIQNNLENPIAAENTLSKRDFDLKIATLHRLRNKMNKKLIEFLIKAKRKTYAGKGSETASSREKSHDLVYRENNFMYYDTYLGVEKFAGEEALWIADNPYWSMNYIGRVTGENFNVDFLKEALLNVPFEKPFRGPERYEDGSYEYKCSINGNFDWFQGKEIISFCGKEVYECYFHGGLIK